MPSQPSCGKRIKKSKNSLSNQSLLLPIERINSKERPIRHILTENLGVGRISHAHNQGHNGVADRYKLILIEAGGIRFHFEQFPFDAKAGDVVFIKPGSEEYMEFTGKSRTFHSWCVVRKLSMTPDLSTRLASVFSPLRFKKTRFLDQLMELLLSCPAPISEASTANFEQMAFCLYYEFLRIFETEAGGEARVPTSINRVLTYLHEHLSDPLDLQEMARAVGISGPHIIRLFRQHLNETPIRHLWNLRIRRGALLLKHTNLSVAEIAYQTGFQYPSHFSRMFKQTFGTSPMDFRNHPAEKARGNLGNKTR